MFKRQPVSLTPESTCPLCGSDNDCAIAAGRPPESCWCMSVAIDPAILQGVPPEAAGRRCICRRCAGVEGESASER